MGGLLIPVSFKWYDLWAAAVSVLGMCGVDGENGWARVAGKRSLFSIKSHTFYAK